MRSIKSWMILIFNIHISILFILIFLEGADHFKKCFIEKGVPEQNIHIDYISSVIAVHTGLGCIAIQYIREEN